VFDLVWGLGGRMDSLFELRAGFSRLRAKFRTREIVVDTDAFKEACSRAKMGDGREASTTTFFPSQRQ
jgi:hypothetical protein